MNDNNKKRNY